jgi:hypothetical protein
VSVDLLWSRACLITDTEVLCVREIIAAFITAAAYPAVVCLNVIVTYSRACHFYAAACTIVTGVDAREGYDEPCVSESRVPTSTKQPAR